MQQIYSRFLTKIPFLLFLLVAQSAAAQAPQKFTISGYIRDKDNGETLLGANVFDKETMKGTVSNEYGFYSLTLPADTYTITVSYIGYNTIDTLIILKGDIRLNIDITSQVE